MSTHAPSISGLVPPAPSQVSITGGFWGAWQRRVRQATIPAIHRRLEEEGFLEVLDFGRPPAPLVRPVQPSGLSMQHFFDSDFGKWIEAASYALEQGSDPALQAQMLESRVDDIAARLAAGQLPDGYLNSWFIRREPHRRWTNLRDWHEMYSLGHLVEGAVAYARATGKRALLDTVVRAVDHAATMFGPGPGQLRGYDAHAEIELALVRLWRFTGDRRHLDFARYLVDERGRMPSFYDAEARARGEDPAAYVYKTYAYSQAHKPVREQSEVVGHAVRATYLYAAMADLAAEDGDDALAAACRRLFDRLMTRQAYVTGGLGPSASNEGFTREYDLPNASAYAETCAAIGLAFFAHRLDRLGLHARHADAVETVLYNGALSGLSSDGEHFFYDNVLESQGQNRRWRWHYCPCCAANVARFVAAMGQYVCSTGEGMVAVHQYAGSVATLEAAGVRLTLEQQTDYPWKGTIRLRLRPERPTRMKLLLRVPGWCRNAAVAIDGAEPMDAHARAERGYMALDRLWTGDEEVVLSLDMPVERLHAHPAVTGNAGRVALRRGPVVYCVEEADVGLAPQRLRLPRQAALHARWDPGLCDGAMVIEGLAREAVTDDWEGLYRPAPPATAPRPFRAVPYHLWANREPGGMAVWLAED